MDASVHILLWLGTPSQKKTSQEVTLSLSHSPPTCCDILDSDIFNTVRPPPLPNCRCFFFVKKRPIFVYRGIRLIRKLKKKFQQRGCHVSYWNRDKIIQKITIIQDHYLQFYRQCKTYFLETSKHFPVIKKVALKELE